jgi:hypothetical protein
MSQPSPAAAGYIEVADRIQEFFAKYPDGCLQAEPPQFITIAGAEFVLMQARAFRTQDDERPGVGTAYEPIPGRTPFTRGSEVQNCETSAWGRALAALGIATKQGIATREEVARVQHEASAGPQPSGRTRTVSRSGSSRASDKQVGAIHAALGERGITDRTQKLRGISAVIGRDITSTSDLTQSEASRVLDSLKPPAQSVPDADATTSDVSGGDPAGQGTNTDDDGVLL